MAALSNSLHNASMRALGKLSNKATRDITYVPVTDVNNQVALTEKEAYGKNEFDPSQMTEEDFTQKTWDYYNSYPIEVYHLKNLNQDPNPDPGDFEELSNPNQKNSKNSKTTKATAFTPFYWLNNTEKILIGAGIFSWLFFIFAR